jgi:hypothetical protein
MVNAGEPPQPLQRRARQPQTAGAGRRSGSGGLTSVHGKSPVGRQGVRLNGCVARDLRCCAPGDSSKKVDGPQRQRPRSHAVGHRPPAGSPKARRPPRTSRPSPETLTLSKVARQLTSLVQPPWLGQLQYHNHQNDDHQHPDNDANDASVHSASVKFPWSATLPVRSCMSRT